MCGDDDDDESAAGGRVRAAWQEVLGEKRGRARAANKHEKALADVFPFCDNKSPLSIVSSIIQHQNIHLPIADKDGIDSKFVTEVIFRCVLIWWIYLQLAVAPLIPRGGVGK